MMTRRDLSIILVTMCLIATLFMIKPVLSPPSQPYDTWTDLNGDGKINYQELGSLLLQYGATGDPTRNVNITNWPQASSELKLVFNQSLGEMPYMQYRYVCSIDVEGYKTVTVHVGATGTFQANCGCWIRCCWNSYGIEAVDSSNPEFLLSNYIDQPDYGCGSNTLTVRSTMLDLYLLSGSLNSLANITLLTIAVFLQK